MKEYTINIRKDGSAVIARDYWNPDKSLKAMEEKPYMFEVGMKVVDIYSNIVTIKEIHKIPSVDRRAPQWTLNVEENNNTYVYYELAGIFVKELSKKELLDLLLIDSSEKQIYEPYDNSWCINLETGMDAYLTKGYSNPEEIGATFIVVSEPYKTYVSYGYEEISHEREFINVKSSKTGNIYRTLFFKFCLIN